MKIYESGEDYLEMILMLQKKRVMPAPSTWPQRWALPSRPSAWP